MGVRIPSLPPSLSTLTLDGTIASRAFGPLVAFMVESGPLYPQQTADALGDVAATPCAAINNIHSR